MKGPCLCGDPYCPRCFPQRVNEAAQKELSMKLTIELFKRSVRMVHGQNTVDELPENFWRVCAEVLESDTNPQFRSGVMGLCLNLAGAQVDQDLKIGDWT